MAEPGAAARNPAVLLLEAPAGSGVDQWADDLAGGLRALAAPLELRRVRLPAWCRFLPAAAALSSPARGARVVHSGTWMAPALRNPPALLITVHLVVHGDPHYAAFRGPLRRLWHRQLKRRERDVIRRADLVVAVSEHVAERVRSLFGVEARVIRNGIDLDLFHPVAAAPSSGGRPRIVTVGAGTARKGVDALIEVARELAAEARVIHAGRVGAHAARRARGAGIELAGVLPRPRIADLLRRSDIFYWPSRCEGFGLALGEAMACGLPVVAADIAPTRELLGAGGSGGMLCPAEDLGSHLAALRRSIRRSPRERARLGAANRDRVVAIGDRIRMAREYAALYRSLWS